MRIDDLNIIVDFISRKLKLIIEVDGGSHDLKVDADKYRDEKLAKYGYTVLRVSESDVRQDLQNVIRVIESMVFDIEQAILPAPL